MRARAALFLVVTVTMLAMAGSTAGAQIFSQTFVVDSTADTGDATPDGLCDTCTLREAIQEANANNNPAEVDLIEFSLGASGVATIFPSSPLPTITQAVDINGYSAPGASQNTTAVGDNADLRIRLDGDAMGGIPAGLRISAANCLVRGLSITRFGGSGIEAFGPAADSNTIMGNFVGITPGGKDRGNGKGVVIASGASDNIVGGTTRQARNIISGNGPSPNFTSSGVDIFSMNMPTTGNEVQGNYIGTDKSGTGDLGNTGRGVVVYDGASNTTIGDDNPANGSGEANIIAFNGFEGVAILDGTGNGILSNSIFSNGRLGIDLGGNGVTPNDTRDTDTGPNNLQNKPAITSARTGPTNTIIEGTLRSIPDEDFTLQFFKNPEDNNDEGKSFIGQKSVSTDADGVITFTFRPGQKVRVGKFITATATHASDTSEFSAPKLVRRR